MIKISLYQCMTVTSLDWSRGATSRSKACQSIALSQVLAISQPATGKAQPMFRRRLKSVKASEATLIG